MLGQSPYTPGRTTGSISALPSSSEAIIGDLLMGGRLGGIFRSGQSGFPYYADDLGYIRASVRKLMELGGMIRTSMIHISQRRSAAMLESAADGG
jgi:hypothetical protein